MESIKKEVGEDFAIQWKSFSLDQQNSEKGQDFMMWEHPEYLSQSVPALVAAKAAKNQGEQLFLRFHLATFAAKHDGGKDIANQKVLRDIAKYAGLDLVRFEQDMAREETWKAVGEDHIESKEKYDVFGVPTMVFEEGQVVFVKLASIPESRHERTSLFELIYGMGAKRPYILELKRP